MKSAVPFCPYVKSILRTLTLCYPNGYVAGVSSTLSSRIGAARRLSRRSDHPPVFARAGVSKFSLGRRHRGVLLGALARRGSRSRSAQSAWKRPAERGGSNGNRGVG